MRCNRIRSASATESLSMPVSLLTVHTRFEHKELLTLLVINTKHDVPD